MIKPGYKTSEFWFTLVSFVFSGLYLIGLINDSSQKEELISNVSHAVESCILIAGQLAILWKYINSRKEIKKTWRNTVGAAETVKGVDEKIEAPLKEETKKTKQKRSKNANDKRNSSNRSRKTNSSSKKLPK